jgi:amino acid adenylation domain-containing protein
MDNGEVFVAGRLKDCIVIRGQNYYPSDIEETVRNSHAALRSAVVAAFGIDIDDHESFVVVAEGPRGADASEFVEPIIRAIGSEHQLKPARVVIVSHSAIPRTSSGKVRRAECRQALAGGSLQTLADRYTEIRNFDEFEMESPAKIQGSLISQIAECAAQLLGCKSEAITAQQDLRELGLDSMRAAELSSALYASVGIGVGILDLLECDSVQEIAALLLNRAGDNAPMARSTETEFPMSGSQAGLWFLSSLTPESSAYQIARAVRIKGTVDPAALDQSFIELLRRHPALRTSFHETDADVMQRVAEEVPSSIVEVIDATEWSLTKLSERLNAAANSPFDLTRPPLFRVRLFVEQASATLLIVAHHLICDLWSLDLLLEELSSLSSRESLPVLTHSFADFVRAERAVLMQAEDSWKYWRETLAGELPVLKMAQAHKAHSAIRPAGQLSFSIDWSETEKLKRLAGTQGGTLHSVLLAVFQLLLHRHSGQEEVIVGTPTFGRHRAELARTVGCFVNTLPVRTRFDGTSSFLDLHARVRDSVRQTVRHSAIPFAKLVEHLSLTRERGTTPAFQAMFAFQKKRGSADEGVSWMAVGAGGGQIRIAELEAETLPLTQGMTQFDLTMTLAETGEGLIGTLAYDSNLFGAPAMAAFVGHFKNLVCEITNRPDRPVGEYDIMPRAERVMQLTSLNDTTRNYGGSDSLHRLLEQQVNLTPDAEALIFGGRSVTYRELDERANAVASVLRDQGEGRGGIVAVCLDRSLELIYTLLGILKVGAAYLPLDPDGPVHRWKDMMAQAGAGVVIGSPDTEPMLSETGVRLVLAEDAASQTSAMNEGATCSADDLAYVIFTSGSTGRPKGVATTHKGITNRLKWMQEKFKLETSDVVLQKTPATFDVSVWEFFWPLMCGARLAIARPGGHRDAAYLAEAIRRHNVTTIHFVPSMLGLFLDEPAAAADCASLRRIICSGEALNPELERKCLETLSGSLHNLYGPTEASVDATAWDCDGQSLRSVPIGFPIANMRAYVLDFEDRIISPAQTGLLHLSGVGLARGYINNPSLTSDRFVPDPYADEPGARMYRTGDLARYRDDGAIEFVGRSDQQVKIRGFRVELQEIEHALAKHPAIKECAVDLQTFSDDVHLVAFFVPFDSLEPDTTALRAHLRESLPHYMVPASFVALETMPLNQNGKLDRKALPKIDRFRFCANQYVKPRTTIERAVTEIWSELLEIPGIGADDNFFELGGHSILASRMMNRIRDTFQIDIPLLAFFEGEPTVASLAERVQAALVGEGSHTERDQNLEPYTGEPLIVVT